MAEQRVGVGEVRDEKVLRAGEDVEEVDSILMGNQRSGEARDEKVLQFGDGGETTDADEDVQNQDSIEFNEFLQSFLGDDYDVSTNLDFGSCGGGDGSLGLEGQIKIQPYVGDVNGDVNPHKIDSYGPRRLRLQSKFQISSRWDGLGRNENDFEPDTNRLDYFRVAPFDVVHGDDDHRGIGNYGGGVPVTISSNNGSGDGDRRDQERDDSTGAGAGYMTQHLPIGISSNNASGGGDGGEVVIQNFEQKRGGVGWWDWWLLLSLWKMV